jgi:hypothetical protein
MQRTTQHSCLRGGSCHDIPCQESQESVTPRCRSDLAIAILHSLCHVPQLSFEAVSETIETNGKKSGFSCRSTAIWKHSSGRFRWRRRLRQRWLLERLGSVHTVETTRRPYGLDIHLSTAGSASETTECTIRLHDLQELIVTQISGRSTYIIVY